MISSREKKKKAVSSKLTPNKNVNVKRHSIIHHGEYITVVLQSVEESEGAA